jgi:hypothetical protein
MIPRAAHCRAEQAARQQKTELDALTKKNADGCRRRSGAEKAG